MSQNTVGAKALKFVYRFVEADDDSYHAWVLPERLPPDVFAACRRAEAVWFSDMEEYGQRGFWAWDPLKAKPVLEKFGYTLAPEVQVQAEKLAAKEKAAEAMLHLAKSTRSACPKCGKLLKLGAWGASHATLHCYSCEYTMVMDSAGREVAAGFDGEMNKKYGVTLFWERVVARQLEEATI